MLLSVLSQVPIHTIENNPDALWSFSNIFAKFRRNRLWTVRDVGILKVIPLLVFFSNEYIHGQRIHRDLKRETGFSHLLATINWTNVFFLVHAQKFQIPNKFAIVVRWLNTVYKIPAPHLPFL